MLRKILSLTLSISLLFQYSGFAQTINLADYLSQSHNSVALDRFRPLALRYFSYEPAVDNFKILLDKGDQKDLSDTKIKDEADRLLTYFKIGLSLPNEKFWVNLRPDAEDQIIDPALEKTDLGKVLLEADLQLKKDTSSLTSPQSKEGKVYWEKLYKKAGELFGTENITIPTITRPWIVPGEIIVRESKDSAYIYKAVLKVMLEEDYLSFQPSAISSQQYVFSDPRLKELNKYSTELIKETILPELTKRINSSKDYASLRQVFFSLILARWFKDKYQGYSVGKGLKPFPTVDSGDLTNLTSKEFWSKTAYFNEYQKSFKDGEYNLSEKVHTPSGQVIRRYTSGGGKFTFEFNDPKVVNIFKSNSPIKPSDKDVVVNKINSDQLAIQEQALSIPLQKKRLDEIIPIIEKILKGITIRKIIDDKKMPLQYTFQINRIEENTKIGTGWVPAEDNRLAKNLNVWSTRDQKVAGLSRLTLSGPYMEVNYILYVIPGKTTGIDLIKAISLVMKDEKMPDETQKEFKKTVENATGFSFQETPQQQETMASAIVAGREVDSINAVEVFDSRMNPTVKVTLSLAGGEKATAEVPSGASTGEREALEMRDGPVIKDIEAGKRPDLNPGQIERLKKMLGTNDITTKEKLYSALKKRLKGKGVLIAVDNVNNIIAPAIKGFDVLQQMEIDKIMISLDGTDNKSNLGANTILAVSLAVARAAARREGLQLDEYIAELLDRNPEIPLIRMMNVINGGEHANWNLDIQEYMIVPLGLAAGAKTYRQRYAIGVEVFNALREILKEQGQIVSVGDEGGFAPSKFDSNEDALKVIVKAIERAGYKAGEDVLIALDPAASQFFNKETGKYELKVDKRELSPSEMVGYYGDLVKKYPIFSIEDGMSENDKEGWKLLTDAAKSWNNEATKNASFAMNIKDRMQIVGDDLFVTNPKIFKEGIEKGLGNSILIKVNQIGTLTETLDAILMAEEAGYTAVIFHRSGETGDTFIADLVVGTGVGQIKTGASRGERVEKDNRIMAIEDRMLEASSAIQETKKFAGDKFVPIYYFGNYGKSNAGLPKGGAKDKELLGGKGANLAEMANYISEQHPELELNVPPGFTVTTEQTKNWNARKKVLSDELMREMRLAIHKLEETMGRKLGDTENLPLLVAVRSGAKKSMPGMMDTILNLGLNDKSVLALAKATNERFAWDCYRRFFEMYGRTVLGVKEDDEKRTGFKHILEEMIIRQAGRKDEYGLNVAELKELVELYKQEIQRQGLPAIPEDPYEQYRYAVEAVFRSSYNDRAMTYRAKEGLKLEETLSAVNVLPMVFGNLDDNSGAGVAFSRNLQNGERKITVEYNINCQGEDVVAGRKKGLSFEELEKRFPEAARSLKAILEFLELHYKDVQDVEFTIENGKLWILQARSAKRTSRAEVKTAMDMYAEGLLKTPEEVIALITPDKMAELLVSQFDKKDKKKAVNEERLLSDGGLDASPGAGVGRNVFDSDRAKELRAKIDDITTRIKNNGEVTLEEKELARVGIILVRDETSPEDLDGMLASVGIWTKKGGRTSHAAVVARQFGIAAVVGDENIEIDVAAKTVTVTKANGSKQILKEGDIVSLDGTGEKGRGQIFIEEIKTVPSFVTTAQYKESLVLVKNAVRQLEEWKKNITGEQAEALRREYDKHIKIYQEHIAKYEQAQLAQDEWDFYRQYQTLNQMANKVRKERGGLDVGGNAEKPLDVLNAVLNGAENFGLVRTEHMFSGDGRELKVQKMILAKTKQKRVEALKELLPLQQVDFEQIFIFADGRPVTIRLIDPPLHEFLPKKEEKIQELADALGLDIQEVKSRIDALHEENPMFGVRGVRLSVLFPEIIEMQVNAIFNAVNKARAAGIQVEPQIMVPLVGNVKEFIFAKQRIEEVAIEAGVKRDSFQIGTMIEIVAGAMNIAEIAREAEFISFGTNDLTQGTLKISRDDGKEWLRKSLAAEIFEDDPFEVLSPEVALFIKKVIEQARAANPKIKIGICGEQGVNVKSIEKYLAPYGLNYVSGGSRRIPGALMAAAKESVRGHKPLEPKAKEEVKIEKKEFPELTSIKGVKDSLGQFREAVAYVRQKGHTLEAKEAALANIDLTKPILKDMVKNAWGDLPVVGDYDEVISWAKELKDMEVTIRVDKSEEKTGAMVGMIDTEPLLFNNGGLRFRVQELLLDNEASEQKRQNRMEFFKKAFVSYLKYTTAKSSEFSVKLPDFALGTIFKYETKQDQEAAIKNLAAALKIEEKEIEARIAQYREANRAIGTRGMRAFFLRNAVPLYAAMAQAALNAAKENGIENVDFILPFLVNGKELKVVLDGYMTDKGETIVSSLREYLKEVKGDEGVNYRFGAVIETPAACVTAEDLAKTADFFVVDAKKLTEAVWAAFEGDTRKGFFDAYRANGIWDKDIFKYAPIETRLLIQEAISRARAQKNNLEVRVITDPQDADLIELSQNLKVNSLIVRSGEDDIAILAAAQAAIKYPVGASSSMVETGAVNKKPVKVIGGIDFRQMSMLIQPQGGFASSSLDFSLPELSKAEIEAFDLAKELELIQRMASSGIDPIDERLKKYLAVCFAKGRTGKEIDDLKLCLEDVFIAQQLDARKTPDGYKEVIVIADTRRFVLKESRLAAGYEERINLN